MGASVEGDRTSNRAWPAWFFATPLGLCALAINCAPGPSARSARLEQCALDGTPNRVVPPLAKPADELVVARLAFRSERWSAATEVLRPLVQRQVRADEETVQEAQFQLAVALDRSAGRRRARADKRQIEARQSAHEIMTAIQEQPHHRRRREAAEWICRRAGGRLAALDDRQRKLYATKAPAPADPAPAPEKQRLATLPDCSAHSCPSNPVVLCLDTKTRNAKCTCDVESCALGSTGHEVIVCRRDEDCPPAGEGILGSCQHELTEADGAPTASRACVYHVLRFSSGQGASDADGPSAEDAAKRAAAAAKGNEELAAGESAAKAGSEAKALRHFAAACDAGNAQGCARGAEFAANTYGTKHDMPRAIKLTARACKLGRSLSCRDNLGCVESREVAVVGRKVSRNSMRVTKSIGVETIGRCERYCAQGLPGACHTAGQYQSAAGHDAKANASFARSCKLGNRDDCE